MPKEKNPFKPTIIDLLARCRRGPQIIMPKDAASIVAVTGLHSGWHCLDAGGGSGFLSLFMANLVQPSGKITTYEKKPENAEIIRQNIRLCGMEKIITLKNKDASKFTEKNLDLIVLDMPKSENLIKKCYQRLKPGGWLCIYSPHIEQQKAAAEEMRKSGFAQIKTIENIQREWKLDNFTHPHPSGILHTGFLTFGRKI